MESEQQTIKSELSPTFNTQPLSPLHAALQNELEQQQFQHHFEQQHSNPLSPLLFDYPSPLAFNTLTPSPAVEVNHSRVQSVSLSSPMRRLEIEREMEWENFLSFSAFNAFPTAEPLTAIPSTLQDEPRDIQSVTHHQHQRNRSNSSPDLSHPAFDPQPQTQQHSSSTLHPLSQHHHASLQESIDLYDLSFLRAHERSQSMPILDMNEILNSNEASMNPLQLPASTVATQHQRAISTMVLPSVTPLPQLNNNDTMTLTSLTPATPFNTISSTTRSSGYPSTRPKTVFCSECGKGFTAASALVHHSRIHRGERPFVCEFLCGRSFTQRCNLVRHHRIHTGEQPFQCQLCHRRFGRKVNLLSHLHNVHDIPARVQQQQRQRAQQQHTQHSPALADNPLTS